MTTLPDLKSVLRIETMSRKPHRLPTHFYESVGKGILEFESEIGSYSKDAITEYVDGKILLESYRSDLLSFLQKRFEKLSVLAIYGISNGSVVTDEEKGLISTFNFTGSLFGSLIRDNSH